MCNKFVGVIIFCLFFCGAKAQFFLPKNYPQNYFIWPVAAIKDIAANFGELRPNHYHMGLDCKTNQKQNLPVLAAADGYIAKVKIEPFGFGQAIYINHPNGLTTLYAHLNSFNADLEKYVKAQQYLLKSWKVFLDIPAHLFEVKKGMIIAHSGNTGGSQGPHLHFEIRDTKTDKVLNPLLFGLPLPDNVPPTILRLAMYDRRKSTYEQTPKIFMLKKINGVYVTSPSPIIVSSNKISFAISAVDKYNGSNNPNGIYQASLFEDEKAIVGFEIDSISYDETRYLNAHIDYKLRSSGGPFVQHLSQLPGYTPSIYKLINGDGIISLNDDEVHKIKIVVKDANNNSSTVEFSIKGTQSGVANNSISFNSTQKKFTPNFINVFENDKISFYLPEKALYDSVYFNCTESTATKGFSVFGVGNATIPLHTYFTINVKSNLPISNADTGKMVLHRFALNKNDYAKATATNIKNEAGWYKASFRDFGNFQLMIDTLAPTILPIGFRDGMNCSKINRIVFVITDNTEEIKNFTATLDGHWLCFSNDKGKTFIYNFDEKCVAGNHELKIRAEDLVGNVTEKIYHFTR